MLMDTNSMKTVPELSENQEAQSIANDTPVILGDKQDEEGRIYYNYMNQNNSIA